MPTQNCLVNLTEWPPFILSLEDVEIASFERIMHGLRHFDIVFVHKDYGKSVQSIISIPVETLEKMKVKMHGLYIGVSAMAERNEYRLV